MTAHEGIRWLTSVAQATAQAQDSGKVVFLNFHKTPG